MGGLGEGGWRRRLHAALVDGRLTLAQYPVLDQTGRLMHLECPLRLQLEPGGPFESAAQWLPLAVRTQTVGAVDLAVVSLALREIARDDRPLGVNLSVASVQDVRFAGQLRERLQAGLLQAPQLWIEVPELAAVRHYGLVRELCQQVKATGARFGLEHAGEQLSRIERLYEIGLDYVKLDARFVLGASASLAHAVADGLSATAGGGISPKSINVDTYTISPYVSYLLTDHLYPLAIAGYSRSEISDTKVNADTFFTDLSMNYGNVVNSWVIRSKAGWRFNHNNLNDTGVGGDDTTESHFLYGAIVGGYAIREFVPYVMVQYEYDASHQDPGVNTDRHYLYLTLGVDVQPTPSASFGIAVQVETINDDSNNIGGIMNARFRF